MTKKIFPNLGRTRQLFLEKVTKKKNKKKIQLFNSFYGILRRLLSVYIDTSMGKNQIHKLFYISLLFVVCFNKIKSLTLSYCIIVVCIFIYLAVICISLVLKEPLNKISHQTIVPLQLHYIFDKRITGAMQIQIILHFT